METGTTVTKGTMSTDVLDMFPGIEASDVLTKPANMFSNDNNLSFLDKPGAVKLDPPTPPEGETAEAKEAREKKEAEDAEKAKAGQQAPPGPKGEADKILDSTNFNEAGDQGDQGDQGAAGEGDDSKKTGRDGITSYLKTKIEAGDFSAFEDWTKRKRRWMPTWQSSRSRLSTRCWMQTGKLKRKSFSRRHHRSSLKHYRKSCSMLRST